MHNIFQLHNNYYTIDIDVRGFWSSYSGNIEFVIQFIDCDSTEARLRDCAYYINYGNSCQDGAVAGVSCRALKYDSATGSQSWPTEMSWTMPLQLSCGTNTVTVGGALGFIIVILVLLLVMCGGALLYLLRSRGVIPNR